ncbi:hypothetical protein QTP70_025866 [Hemibagrus guttatus]|uniref:C-type lectin domain-containing protein n=1 Tax=Hemibagrus guttatus TaxID=175788 RepID=A0AAE0UYI4_9TELE|nr:hypothetical protein QTP70_025866 [Hemibagrus guttatus]
MEEMNTLLDTVNGSYSGLAWIGLYDDVDTWRWSLDDDAFYQEGERDFRGWPHQPDNYNGSEMCVVIGYGGKWFDSPCTDRKSFVCYNAFTPGAVMGLRMKVTANENLLNSQIKRLVLMELQQELSGLGLSSNYTVNVRNIRKLGP